MLRRIFDEIRRSAARSARRSAPPPQAAARAKTPDSLRDGRLRDALAELAQELSASAETPELQRLLIAGLIDLARRNQDADTHDKIAFLLGAALLSRGDVDGAAACARARSTTPGSLSMRAFRLEPSLPAYCRQAGLPVIDAPGLDAVPMSAGAEPPGRGAESFSCALRPGLVLGTSFIPATAGGEAFTERCIHRPDKIGQFEAGDALDTVLLGTSRHLLAGFSGTDRHAGVHVLLGSSANAGHWLLNFFSRLLLAERIPGLAGASYVIGDDAGPMQLDCLARAGIPAHRIVRLAPGRLAEFEELWVPSMPYGFVDGPALCWIPGVPAFIRRALGLSFDAPRTRRVFLTRARTRWRRLVNEADVLAAIDDLGFEIVDPGTLSLAAQIELAASAQIIAGTMGAGMNLLLFAAQGTPVVTIKGPIRGMMDIDPFLTRALGQPYFAVTGASLPTSPDPLKCDIEAPPAQVRSAVLQALQAAGAAPAPTSPRAA